MMKLDVRALALAVGTVFGISAFAISMVAAFTGVGRRYLETIGELHPGYLGPTPLGALIHAFWMFVYGAIGGGLVGTIYNYCTGMWMPDEKPRQGA